MKPPTEMMLDYLLSSRGQVGMACMNKIDAIKGASYSPLVPSTRLVCVRTFIVCTSWQIQRNSA